MLSMTTAPSPQRAQILAFTPRPSRVLAEFSTQSEDAQNPEARWTRLRISRVASSKYLCEKVRGPDPEVVRSATVGNLESAKAFFGGGWVVKELFAALDPVRFPRW